MTHTMQMPEMQACIEACLNCFKECEYCGEKCIGMPEMAAGAKACFDCATTCQTCVTLMARESDLHTKACDYVPTPANGVRRSAASTRQNTASVARKRVAVVPKPAARWRA